MFQMYPGALDAEMERRHELAAATMQAAHGTGAPGRVLGVARFRHVVTALVIGAIAFIR